MTMITGLLPVVAAMMLAAPAAASSQEATACDGGDRDSCSLILGVTAELAGMLVTSDPAPLERHLDPRAVWMSSSGEVRSGAALIAAIRQDTPRATSRVDRAHVRFFGDVAIVAWQESWTAPGAAVAAGRLAGVDTWARADGRWRIVATAEVRVAP